MLLLSKIKEGTEDGSQCAKPCPQTGFNLKHKLKQNSRLNHKIKKGIKNEND